MTEPWCEEFVEQVYSDYVYGSGYFIRSLESMDVEPFEPPSFVLHPDDWKRMAAWDQRIAEAFTGTAEIGTRLHEMLSQDVGGYSIASDVWPLFGDGGAYQQGGDVARRLSALGRYRAADAVLDVEELRAQVNPLL